MCRVYWIEDREREGGEDREGGKKGKVINGRFVKQRVQLTAIKSLHCTSSPRYPPWRERERESVCVCDGRDGAWELSYSY